MNGKPTNQMKPGWRRDLRRTIWRVLRDNPGLTYRELTPLLKGEGSRFNAGADLLVHLKELRNVAEVSVEWGGNWDTTRWYALDRDGERAIPESRGS